MKTASVIILILFASFNGFSQAKKAQRYALYAEIGKTGFIYSVVFDNRLKDARYGLKGGMGANFGGYREAIMGQVGAYRLFGKQAHFFETGIDLHYLHIDVISDDQRGFSSLVYPDYPTKTYYISVNGGYRMISSRTVFRAGVAPGFTKDEFIPGGYISFGFGF